MRLNELIAVLLEAIGRFAWPSLRVRMARLAASILPDTPVLAGDWVASFMDVQSAGTTPATVEISLTQFGIHVKGVGHVSGYPADTFRFCGTIKRNVFFGSFARKDAHVLAGTGAFVLKIDAHSRRLSGGCLWYDGMLDEVWNSPYSWRR